jgi:serine/threonine protein kinase/formylglycine-generating enzyme required for sulfatase activity
MTTPSAFGRYQIKDKLGRGGMAEVYLAYDPRFERDVAVKLLPQELMYAPGIRARFEQEAKTIAALDHPAIVPVYDFGEQEGQLYLVMRYMAGGSLGDRLENGPLPLEETQRIISRIAPALDEAHQKGVIHRDIKPGNILFDHRGEPALADFGIVRLAESTMQLTGSGWVGTPAFMAPEMGDPGGVTPLVDIYALGVTVYMMLTGQHPYQADTPSGYIVAHITKPVPNILALRPDLPPGTQAVIEGALAKDPLDRCQSAGALAAGLREVAAQALQPVSRPETSLAEPPIEYSPPAPDATLSDAPPTATRRATPPRPTSPARRGFPFWVVGVLGLVIVLGLVFTLWVRELIAPAAVAEPTITPTPTDTPTPIPTLTAGEQARQLAVPGVSRNADWTPYTETINGVEMALVPAGCFQMGSEHSRKESPVHRVCFEEPFWIDVYEVTNRLFGSVGCASYSSDPDQPRNCVNWADSVGYCVTRGVRLPTEAEWEYAARGPDSLVYPWGNEFVADNVVSYETSEGHVWAVGSKPGGVSWVGAYDLSGNVWEWVNDRYDADYFASSPVDNPQGPGGGVDRVLRGGSWYDNGQGVRAARRDLGDPGDTKIVLGFRCALSYNPDS